MENDVLITEENMFDLRDRDLAGMEATLKALDMEITHEELPQKPVVYKTCRCGNALFESPEGQFRCGNCGNIKYNKTGGLRDGI